MSAISVKGLTKNFKTFTAVDDLNFDIPKNHVVGFLGPNGAGKTTTLRMLVGLSKPTKGNITICDKQVIFGKSDTNHHIGYLPELPSMYGWMTGYEYLYLISDISKLTNQTKISRIKKLLELVNLTAAKDKKISTYSGGMKQRLGIAQALINNPEVVILDEPVSALDPIGRKEVLEIIEKLKQNHTILLSTHILSDVDKICDDVIIIKEGKLIVASPLTKLKEKYASPILEIEFSTDPTKALEKIKGQKWVKHTEQSGKAIKIWLSDETVIDKNIPLDFLLSQKIGILRYGLTLPETEDLFIELLGENK